jgi:hypothetical protein
MSVATAVIGSFAAQSPLAARLDEENKNID